MKNTLIRIALASGLICVSTVVLRAQQDRIPSLIDNSRTVVLKGPDHPIPRAQDDQGPVDPSMEIAYATLYLKPSGAQQAALEMLLLQQQDAASPNYRRWLTPEQYADRFGLSRGDIAKVVAWLESQGLKVDDVARGRHWITFTGSAAGVGQAFHTEFHRYITNGVTHFANATAPSIPEALADVVNGIGGLDDYDPTPAYGKSAESVLPDGTSASGSHYLSPDDIATIYDLNPLYAAGFDGTGQKIAVIGNSDLDLTDIQNFRTHFKLPQNPPQTMLVGPDPNSTANLSETDIDLEWSGAVARNATLIYVYAKSVNTAAQYAVDQNVAPVITMSYGACEQATTPLLQPIAQQANSQGITWVASTGDVGAAGCERQEKLPQASKGLAIQIPASIPEITAVGGTEFADANGAYWNSTNTATYGSAISYIPEKAWNDSLAYGYLASSTGGASIFFAKPSWQTGPGVPNDNARDVPDVALSASWDHDGYLTYSGGGSGIYGGTSVATPEFAGFLAILNQYLLKKGALSQPGLGNVNPTLYRLAQTASSAFHDVVNGNNIVPCMQGTADCGAGSFGFTTNTGYDPVTGLGSIDANNLAANWTNGTSTITTLTAAPATVSFNGGSVQLTATVAAASAAPSGIVTFLYNDTPIGTATLSASSAPNASFSATLTIGAIQLPVGTDTITAVYGGSGSLAGSAATTVVTVTAPAAASAVAPSVSPNPVYQQPPNSNGFTWFYTITLTNQDSVATTLTKFTINGSDYSSEIGGFFGTAAIPANGAISASVSSKGYNPPANVVFGFAGSDAGGAAWSQQITVPFVARVLEEPSLLLTTPATVQPNAAADPSCRWSQPLVLEERGGYDIRLTTLTSGSTNLSSQLQQIFGTTTIAPFGRLQGTLCWSGSTTPATVGLVISGATTESGGSVSTSASTTLASTAFTTITPSVSPASISLSSASGITSGTVALSFNGGSPQWTAAVSPSNLTTAWLTVAPLSGAGATQLSVTASAAGLAGGVYYATLLIQSVNATPQFLSVPVVLVVGGSSNLTIGGVSNAASGKVSFAPGMLMSVYGTNLSPKAQHAGSVPLPLNMQGVTATVNGVSAPLLDVSPGQLNLQVPYETGAGTAILGVNNNGQVTSFPFQVGPSAPGIFMDGGGNLVPYASGQRGQILLAFITGEGDVTPPVITGATTSQLPPPALPATLTVGSLPATIDFIGIPGGLVGVTQINFTVPPGVPLGPQPVVVTVGGVASPPVTLTVTQ
ncbi:MAG: protease pro-enzyme activation domain-containing protein [Bryobacteraceae bacterium]